MLTVGRARQAIVEWRNWGLPVKLAAVVVVPVVFAVALSATQIRAQITESDQYARVGHVVDTVNTVQPLITSVQLERARAADWLTGAGNPGALAAQATATDRAAAAVTSAFQDPEAYGPVVAARYVDARTQLAGLAGLRQQVEASRLDSASAIRFYDISLQSLLALDQALSNAVGDPVVSSAAAALHDLAAADEEVRQQQAWMLTGLSDGDFSSEALGMLRDSRARLDGDVADFSALVTPDQQASLNTALAAPPVQARNQNLSDVLARNPGFSRGVLVAPAIWNANSEAAAAAFDNQRQLLSGQLRQRVAELEDDASNAAGLDSVILLSALLLAGAIMLTVTRQLLRSLRVLRHTALDAAEYELPRAVASIRTGDKTDADADIAPVPVQTTEEVGQVARAFDEVYQQALRLAAEQATLRRGYSDSFVNVSRRSQSLLERQLLLFEQLEQDEEDPDQLARLFQLDHLATRMRRNNENLMVLSGSDLARPFSQPVALADVLRAAVSEIEHYPRVIVQSPPTVELLGHVGSDLVRLVAELLDNAANFSAPDTSVTVSSHLNDESLTIDVLDRGIGMTDQELTEANTQLANAADAEATSRRMGLLVAGRLAARHGITVVLHGGRDVEGVRATVLVPSEHIASDQERDRPGTPSFPGRNGASLQDLPTSGSLPQREAAFGDSGSGGLPRREAAFGDSGSGGLPRREAAFGDPGSGGLPRRQAASGNPTQGGLPRRDSTFGEDTWPPEPAAEQTRGLFEPTVSVTPVEVPPARDYEPSWPAEEPEMPPARETTTEWFQPSLEDARFQAQAQQEYDQRGWPADAPAPPDPPVWRAPESDGLGSGQRASAPTWNSASEEPRRQAQPPTSTGLPRRARATPGESAAPEESPRGPQPAREGAWSFAMDDARQLAEAAANPDPASASYTSAGLPRRTPRAQLAPGSVPSGQDDNGSHGEFRRDADHLRGRLADFQSGVRRGKHSAD
jgi:hypothetical protein